MEYDCYKEVETLKASIWKKVFATISFWVLIFFGGSVVMLWNAISPSMAQYRPGDLGYTVLQIISTGVGSVLAVLAFDSITKSKCQLLCAINCTISATFMGVLIALNILLKNGNVSRYISVGFAFAILIYFAYISVKNYEKDVEKDLKAAQEEIEQSEPVMELFKKFSKQAGMTVPQYTRYIRIQTEIAAGKSEQEAVQIVEQEDAERMKKK